jgi:hypothetical protein
MLEFIPKPRSFKPIEARLWEREFGSEFNKWEFQLLKEFNQAKQAKNPVISGTVVVSSRFGKGCFLLIPAPHLGQDQVICICPPSIPVPADRSYVTVYGKKQWFRDHYEIVVEDILPAKMKVPIKPEIKFKDFQDLLLLKWNGIDSPLRELLAFEFVSSPPLYVLHQVGGINLSVYDGTGVGLSKKLLHYFRRIVPPEVVFGESCSLEIPYMNIRMRLMPFSWSFKVADADNPSIQPLVDFLCNRRSGKFSEISLGLGSAKSAPTSIYDPPVALVDQPTILPSTAEKRSINMDPPLEVTKYIVTMQMFHPTVGETQRDFEKVLDEASSKVVELAMKYDVPYLVKKHAILDPQYYGKPQSILRIALASARAHEKSVIDSSWVLKVFNDYCVKNMDLLFEAWPEFFTSKGVEIVSLKNELDRQVVKFITENETTETGVGFHLIEEHFFNRSELELRESLRRLLDYGKIREIKYDVFRSVPFK